MPEPLVTGTLLTCSFGAAPSAFVADPLPGTPEIMGALPAATIAQITPANVLPFGMCSSQENPAVASATAAAQGVLTPMPCTPVVAAPWAPASIVVKVNGLPMATVSSKCVCSFGGQISVSAPMPGPAESA